MSMVPWWNVIDRKKTKNSENNKSQFHFAHMDWPGDKFGLQWRLVTNHLSRGMACRPGNSLAKKKIHKWEINTENLNVYQEWELH
jgi:predicted 3-demethylubiquinone-9 3-methyltransferase (glyoxalase superfamily)